MASRMNFGAGPAMVPTAVMEKIQAEFLDYQGMGVSVVEISHRSEEFLALIDQSMQRFRKLLQIPLSHEILYVHGGAQMQFSAIPLNLIQRSPSRTVDIIDTDVWSSYAFTEAQRYGNPHLLASSKSSHYNHIPDWKKLTPSADSAYVHLVSNNTLFGTQWKSYPQWNDIPLVIDTTSDLLSQPIDFMSCGVVFASTPKNLGVSGLAVVIIRKDLLGNALPETPNLLNYKTCLDAKSLINTPNTFAIYVMNEVLGWVMEEGGLSVMEERSVQRAQTLYDVLDHSSFYRGMAQPQDRSLMSVTFDLPSAELLEMFLQKASEEGFYGLKGHRLAGGARASIYNAMPQKHVEALAALMKAFEQLHG